MNVASADSENINLEDFDIDTGRDAIRLSLDFKRDLPDYDILDHITWDRWENVPGAYKLEIVGIHNSLLGQVRRRFVTQLEDDLDIEWNLSNMSISEYRDRQARINNEYNPYGEWWDRSWIYSLPPEKGGAPRKPIIKTVGWDIQITDSTPLVGWFKQQFDKLGDIWISVDHEFNEVRGVERNNKKNSKDAKDYNHLRIQEANIGVERPWRWFESGFYHLRFKPTVKISSNAESGFLDEAALRIQVELYMDDKSSHFGTLNFFVRHDFNEKDTFFSVFFELVNF